jgi:hypothetical protein
MNGGVLDNVFFLTFLAWPGVVVGCALLNMLLQWSFSWSELCIDYLAGMTIGLCFYFGTEKKAHEVAQFFLVFSNGLLGLLHVCGVKALAHRDVLFGVSAGAMGGSVLIAGLLDMASNSISKSMNVWGGLLSILIAPMKLPFSFCTSGVGLLLWLAGLFTFIVRSIILAVKKANHTATADDEYITRVGILCGVPYVEWSPRSGMYATTIGSFVMVWAGPVDKVIRHESYHTRQYIYLHDWLMPFWVIGGLWGLVSAQIVKHSVSFDDFAAASSSQEVGNPIERAAYGGGD